MRAQHQVFTVLLSLCWLQCFAAGDSFYQHYIGILNTNETKPIAVYSTVLVDTNNTSSKLANIEISLETLRAAGEVGGIHLGMTMDEVVLRWGKPKRLYANCGPGPRFIYTDVTLNFKGNALDRIYLPQSARFSSGLGGDSKLKDWVRVLGKPMMQHDGSGTSLVYETQAPTRTVLLLSFDAEGDLRTCPTLWRDPSLTNWFKQSAP